MNRLTLFAIFMMIAGISLNLNAQDRIYLLDGSMIEAKVKAIDKYKVTYVSFDKQEGPEYFLQRKDALMIVYEDGTSDIVSNRISAPGKENFRRNIFAFHLFDLVYNNFSLSYERLNKDGTLGFQIPVIIGYGEVDVRDYQNIISSGIAVNFYPTGQGVWKYFMGPALEAGIAKDSWYYYDDWLGMEVRNDEEYFFGRLMVNNGIMFMPIDSFHVSASAGLGIRYLSDTHWSDDRVRTTFQFNLNLGYRF